MRIIARIDQVGNPDIDVMPLQSATAADTARVLNSLLAQTGEAATGVKIVADDRSNSISSAAMRPLRLRVRALVRSWTRPIETGTTTQVRYLRYSDADGSGRRGSRSNVRQRRVVLQLDHEQAAGKQQPVVSAHAQRPGQHRPLARRHRHGGDANAGGRATHFAGRRHGDDLGRQGHQCAGHDRRRAHACARSTPSSTSSISGGRRCWYRPSSPTVAVDKTADLGINWAVDGSATGIGVGGFISPIGGILDHRPATTMSQSTSNLCQPTRRPAATIGIGRLKASGINFALMLRALQSDARTNIIATPLGGHARQSGSEDGSGPGSAVPDRPVLAPPTAPAAPFRPSSARKSARS